MFAVVLLINKPRTPDKPPQVRSELATEAAAGAYTNTCFEFIAKTCFANVDKFDCRYA